ncbi:hypothetical protein [Aeromicrobium sp. UC242_57]|uniref:hypothetical protein n=1 Tax=Aeromicrobium sp. UC242_57 TaxID=3374624 RepID=UPI0037970F76
MIGDEDFGGVQRAVRRLAARVHDEAPVRERDHLGVADVVPDLLATGIGRLRVPRRYGGIGTSVAGSWELSWSSWLRPSPISSRSFVGISDSWSSCCSARTIRLPRELLAAAGRGEFFGPAASSKGGPSAPTDGEPRSAALALTDGVWLHDDGAGLRLSGTKYYSTGSLYADWINVLVPHEGGFVEVVVSRTDPGVSVVDDWNGFGQRMTASGTATFEAVAVREDYVLPHRDAEVAELLGAFYQFIHSATQAGIAHRASQDVARLVRGRRRSYPLAADPEPRHDAQVLGVVGEISTRAFTARATVSALGATIDDYLVSGGDLRPEALKHVVVESAQTQVVNSRLAGEVGWLLFDAASASALDLDLALDRHWRNARAVSSHNPSIYKARLVGDFAVNGTLPSPAFAASPVPERAGV